MITAETWLQHMDHALQTLESTSPQTTAESIAEAVTILKSCHDQFTDLDTDTQEELVPTLPRLQQRISQAMAQLEQAKGKLSNNHNQVLKNLQAAQAYGTAQDRK